jgi:hypothetical protein
MKKMKKVADPIILITPYGKGPFCVEEASWRRFVDLHIPRYIKHRSLEMPGTLFITPSGNLQCRTDQK